MTFTKDNVSETKSTEVLFCKWCLDYFNNRMKKFQESQIAFAPKENNMIRATTNIKSSVFTEHIKPKDPQNNFHKKAYYFSQGKNPEIEIEREI